LNFNRVFLGGNLTRDPELRHLPNSNTAVCKFGLAINRKFRTADGQQKEEVTFVDCDCFGKTAEMIAQYLRKGRPLFVEGHLKLDQWEKDGVKQSRLKVVVDSFQFVDAKPESAGQAPKAAARPATKHEPVGEEDIPF
jgi:single-strand DNA-binding protein